MSDLLHDCQSLISINLASGFRDVEVVVEDEQGEHYLPMILPRNSESPKRELGNL